MKSSVVKFKAANRTNCELQQYFTYPEQNTVSYGILQIYFIYYEYSQTSFVRTPINRNPRYPTQNCWERVSPNAFHLEMACFQSFSGPDRPWPATSSPLTARGPMTFILFQTILPMAR